MTDAPAPGIGDDANGATNEADLVERVDALERAASLATGRLDDDVVDAATTCADRVRARLRHGTDRTVVALAGPTGVGKSSLFNALVGAEVSTRGVKRPTTSAPHAALWGGDEPRLLRWLDISRRFLVPADEHANGDDALDGLILIDLPDLDSVAVSNRLEAGRLIDVVDALVWVVDPQKYADELFHRQVAALAQHSDVMRFVITKTDLVASAERPVVAADLVRRLENDGIASPVVWAVAVPPNAAQEHVRGRDAVPGLAALRRDLSELVMSRKALAARLDADLRAAADGLRSGGGRSTVDPDRIADVALEEVSKAALSNELAAAVGTQYRRNAQRATGWLPAAWLRRRRPDPTAQVTRRGTVDRLRIESALRAAAETATEHVGSPWDRIVRREVMARTDDVADALRARSVNVARHAGAPPRWWSAWAWMQRILAVAAAVGVVWLFAVGLVGGLGLATDPLMPRLGPTPIPSMLAIGGCVIGILLGFLARFPIRAGAARRAASARRALRADTAMVLRDEVVAPIEHVLTDRAEIDRLAGMAARR